MKCEIHSYLSLKNIYTVEFMLVYQHVHKGCSLDFRRNCPTWLFRLMFVETFSEKISDRIPAFYLEQLSSFKEPFFRFYFVQIKN